MNTKVKTTAVIIGALAIGYFIGAFFGLPETSSNLASGNVAKVSKYHKATVSPKISAFQEKLQNDPEALESASITMAVLSSRMEDFSLLVDKSISVAGDMSEFSEEVDDLRTVKELSDNAVQAGRIASASLESLVSGENSEISTDYEQASNNLTVAYLMVERQVKLGKNFYISLDNYLLKNTSGNPELIEIRDLWGEYCAGSAILNGDNEEKEFWGKQGCLSDSNTSVAEAAYSNLGNIISKVEKGIVCKLDKEVAGKLDKEVAGKLDKEIAGKLDKEVAGKLDKEVAGKLDKEVAGKLDKEVAGKLDKEVASKIDKEVANKIQTLTLKTDRMIGE